MEHCSEQDDAREREAEQENDLDEMMLSPGKRQRLSKKTSVPTGAKYGDTGRQLSAQMEVEVEAGGHEDEQGSLASTSSSRKPSVSGSLHGDEKLNATKPKSSKSVAAAQKRAQRHASDPMTLGEVIDKIDEETHPEDEPQSLAGKGLRIYAQCVRRRVEAKGSTSYNELVHELFGGKAGENVDDLPEVPGQENIRRRVYDALNVLEALDIISFDNKDIRWVGLEESKVVQDVSQRKVMAIVSQQGRQPHKEEGDEESEEPEDDDMEIEKLQKEVEAMKLRNELVRAQLQDQVTRHVQVLNLVKRNKKREAKEQEREDRRRQRKEERRARASAADQDPSMTDVGPVDCTDSTARKSDRHHRRRRTSREASERPEGDIAVDSMDDDALMKDTDGKSKRQCESTGEETTQVKIQIPQNDELSIISDTEILGDLGFNAVTLDDLQAMLPNEDLMEAAQYVVNARDRQQQQGSRRRTSDMSSIVDESAIHHGDAAAVTMPVTGETSVIVRGGHEREIVRAASEAAESS
ncbi:Transcription factor Dp-2 [Mortierella sp. AD031]|nr:Transcription factor Dp-2 [Mortierella sp. AD031]